MTVYILHAIAALLWALAILFAGVIGMVLEQKKHEGLFEMLALLAVLSGAAFTLQVIA
jgi:hypothetical protein